MKASFQLDTASGIELKYSVQSENDLFHLPIPQIPQGTKSVEFTAEVCSARIGEKGFFLLPNGWYEGAPRNAALVHFLERPDQEDVFPVNHLPVFGVCHDQNAWLGIVTGMNLSHALVVRIRNGIYTLSVRFPLDGEKPYEEPALHFIRLKGRDASCSGLARAYRSYQLERGACRTLRERAEENPVLRECVQGPLVRLRLAWKQAPSPIRNQTPETEPPIHVAMTFEQAGKIIDEFHRQGIDHAEFCLVGWNKSGHDGRFPDLFPVEPLLGGEEGLRKLIAKATSYGYLISCHTEILSGYTIAKRFSYDDLIIDRNGRYEYSGPWSGGIAYRFCPKAAYEHLLLQDIRELRKFGFRGTHYLDVTTIVAPTACCNPKHPLTPRESARWRGKSLEAVRSAFGASGSEGGWDFAVNSLDYVLYAVFEKDRKFPEICDEIVPFWFLVYHGILLYNAYCDTVNSAIKPDPSLWLANVEAGGRPLAYYYAKFMSNNSNWMGDEDLRIEAPGGISEGVSRIKREYDSYRTIADLQYELIREYETVAPEVTRLLFENGTILYVNRSRIPYRDIGSNVEVPPLSFVRKDSDSDQRI